MALVNLARSFILYFLPSIAKLLLYYLTLRGGYKHHIINFSHVEFSENRSTYCGYILNIPFYYYVKYPNDPVYSFRFRRSYSLIFLMLFILCFSKLDCSIVYRNTQVMTDHRNIRCKNSTSNT